MQQASGLRVSIQDDIVEFLLAEFIARLFAEWIFIDEPKALSPIFEDLGKARLLARSPRKPLLWRSSIL
jgi:hypothetical protein